MKINALKYWPVAALLAVLLTAAAGRAQTLPLNSGTNLSSVVFFDPPYEQQVMVRLSGAEMTSLPDAIYDVKKLKIEKYNRDGKLFAVAQAPTCLYAVQDEVASSAGHLELNIYDGKVLVQGDGFLWQQSESSLVISNHVHTVIKTGTWKLQTL